MKKMWFARGLCLAALAFTACGARTEGTSLPAVSQESAQSQQQAAANKPIYPFIKEKRGAAAQDGFYHIEDTPNGSFLVL